VRFLRAPPQLENNAVVESISNEDKEAVQSGIEMKRK
jgi:hypothetical protein